MTAGKLTTPTAASFPPANLPSSALAWSRAVGQRIAQLEDAAVQSGSKALEQNKTLVQTLRRTRPDALVYRGEWKQLGMRSGTRAAYWDSIAHAERFDDGTLPSWISVYDGSAEVVALADYPDLIGQEAFDQVDNVRPAHALKLDATGAPFRTTDIGVGLGRIPGVTYGTYQGGFCLAVSSSSSAHGGLTQIEDDSGVPAWTTDQTGADGPVWSSRLMNLDAAATDYAGRAYDTQGHFTDDGGTAAGYDALFLTQLVIGTGFHPAVTGAPVPFGEFYVAGDAVTYNRDLWLALTDTDDNVPVAGTMWLLIGGSPADTHAGSWA